MNNPIKFPIKIEGDKSTFFIYWKLTDFCNYRCNYCPIELHSGNYSNSPEFPSEQQIDQFLENLETKHLINQKLNLMLSGGEPTLHPLFPKIVDRLGGLGKIAVTTNASRSAEWWRKLNRIPDDYLISLHPEYSNVDKINELGNWLLSQNKTVVFNLSLDVKNWDQTVNLYNNLDEKLQARVWPKVLIDLFGNKKPLFELNQDQKNWFLSVQEKTRNFYKQNLSQELYEFNIIYNTLEESKDLAALVMSKQNNFLNWKCAAGIEGISIHFDGKVYAGICQQKFLGKLDNFSLLNEYVTCKMNFCVCNGDIRLSKYKVN